MVRLTSGAALAAILLASGYAQAQSYTPYTPTQNFVAEANNNGSRAAGQFSGEQRVMGLRVPNGFRDQAAVSDDVPHR